MEMKKILFTGILMSAVFFMLQAEDFDLIRDGKAVSNIVVAKDAPAPVRFGASELGRFLRKISEGEEVKVSERETPSLYNVFVGTKKDEGLLKASGIDGNAVRENGFAITAGPKGLYIIGGDELGALYGCYEILKNYGGIRWLLPGDDGEYFKVKKTISVPAGSTVRNPSLPLRLMDFNSCYVNRPYFLTREWEVRNGLQPTASLAPYAFPQNVAHLNELGTQIVVTGGHVLTPLLFGGKYPNQAEMDKLFAEHPEYFPMINGKRIMLDGQKYQPCTSNPEVLDRMTKSLLDIIQAHPDARGLIVIGNNDGSGWCECAECRKIDPPEEARLGRMSTRYWTLVNTLAQRVWKVYPYARLGGWAYQNFWMPPLGIKPDKRLEVCLSFNNQCWRHAINDPDCSVNREFNKLYRQWKELGLIVHNRDEIAADGAVGSCYLPSESVLYKNFKIYPELGLAGSRFCIIPPPPDASFYRPEGEFQERNLNWFAMWQTNYMSAQFMYDISLDYDKVYEECNRLYYGKAWEGGMKEYRALLTKAFLETPGCQGWGLGAPLGRCLDQAGVHAKLLELLDKAEKAAASDPDPRALIHVRRDRDIFRLTWEAARKNYLENFKELNVYRKNANIRIDGVLDETDWKNADVLSNFKLPPWQQKAGKDNLAAVQTFVRAVYDPDFLYLAVECIEPHPEKLKFGKDVPPDDTGWPRIGDHVELFYSYPDMADRYFHLAINPGGGIISAIQNSSVSRDTRFHTQAEFKTSVLPDRWILEMRIPTAEIGMKCFDGGTWKLNVARARSLNDGTAELSSCSNGSFHGSSHFVNIKFTPARGKGLSGQADFSAWKNSTFNDTLENAKQPPARVWKEWKSPLIPKYWGTNKAVGSLKLKEGSTDDYYVELEKGILTQWYTAAPAGKLRITLSARGHGSFGIWAGIYLNPPRDARGYPQYKVDGKPLAKHQSYEIDSDQWKPFTFECDYKVGDRVYVYLMQQKGTISFDDVVVSPYSDQ